MVGGAEGGASAAEGWAGAAGGGGRCGGWRGGPLSTPERRADSGGSGGGAPRSGSAKFAVYMRCSANGCTLPGEEGGGPGRGLRRGAGGQAGRNSRIGGDKVGIGSI